jgi:hypothetical protein
MSHLIVDEDQCLLPRLSLLLQQLEERIPPAAKNSQVRKRLALMMTEVQRIR